jgi:acyl-CoA synthetase (NDP forming)
MTMPPGTSREVKIPETTDPLFAPRAVAVVGASPRSDLARRLLQYLGAFGHDRIFAVNPRYRDIDGVTCYPSLADVPTPVDLVVVMVRADRAVEVVEGAGAIGARTAVVFASGFAELGPDGARRQQRLVAAANAAGVRILGPNCQGVVHTPSGLYCSFSSALSYHLAEPSGLAYIGQSGALGGAFLRMATARGLGLTTWVSTGNQADFTVCELTEKLLPDPAIKVLALYFEALPDGVAWLRLTDQAVREGKFLVVLRSGRSDEGRRAALSHTGAMVQQGSAFDLTAAQYGAVQVDHLEDLVNASAALLSTPPPSGAGVGLVTSSGGAGALAADELTAHDLTIPGLAAETRRGLAAVIPSFGAAANPVDVTAEVLEKPDMLGEVCKVVALDPSVDAVLVVLTSVDGPAAVQVADSLQAAAKVSDEPIYAVWLAPSEAPERRQARAILRQAGIPSFESLVEPIRVIKAVRAAARSYQPEAPIDADEPWIRDVIDAIPDQPEMAEAELGSVVAKLGIQRPESVLARTATEAVSAAERLGHVVLKVQSGDIAHKTELGAVAVGVPVSEVARRYTDMLERVGRLKPEAALEGVLVQRKIDGLAELIVSVTGAWNGYPALVTVGLGGITTELYKDVISRIAPVSVEQGVEMLKQLRCWPLLEGYRGRPRADVRAAADVIAVLSRLAARMGDRLQEFEINPLIVRADGLGAVAVDLLARLHEESPRD